MSIRNIGGKPALTQYAESSEWAITPGGLFTWAHGLGVVPKFYEVILVCQVAEYNYAVGDEVFPKDYQATLASSPISAGCAVQMDATNLLMRIGNRALYSFNVPDWTTGALQAITSSKWKLKVRVWA